MKEKKCPRCGATFICNHENVSECQCASVTLSPETRRYISAHYADCLCAACLKQLEQDVSAAQTPLD